MFEGVKECLIEYNYGYGSSKSASKYSYISSDDLKTLGEWLKNSVIPFKGFSGKLFFPKSTEFPRYKFREYSLATNGTVSRVINTKNADACVVDLENLKEVVKSRNLTNKTFNLVTNKEAKQQELPYFVETKALGSRISKEKQSISYFWGVNVPLHKLCEDYRSYLESGKVLPFIDVAELTKALGKQYEAIDAERAEQLLALLKSQDRDSIKTGMEVLTNCDIEASLMHIMLIFSQAGSNMRSHAYWNGVSFKTFREALSTKKINYEYLSGSCPVDVVQEYLKIKGSFVQEEDIPYIKGLIRTDIEESYNFEESGFKLTGYEIELDIASNKIIKKEVKESNKELV